MADFEQKPLSGDWTGEPRWLREKRAREERIAQEEAARQLEGQIRAILHYGYERYIRNPYEEPPKKPDYPVIGDYLYYFLGGPLNCTQEFHWSERLPRDGDLLRRAPMEPITVIPPDQPPKLLEFFTYRTITLPKSETPFSDVQVFLALYQG